MAAHKHVKGEKKWWYDIGAIALVCAFLLVLDIMTTGAITWAQYPIVAVLFFVGGFKLLDKMGRE